MARVLVIDDEPDVRWVVRFSLERAGHEVIMAADGLRGSRWRNGSAPMASCWT
jgi:CheY-like chemotaxis protein